MSLSLFLAILALHVSCGFLKGKWQTALNIVNLLLHAALVLFLIYDGVPLDEAVLAYMASVLTYTVVRVIVYKRGAGDR